MLDYFLNVKILVGDIDGGAPEWRPRRPPIPPVGKTTPAGMALRVNRGKSLQQLICGNL